MPFDEFVKEQERRKQLLSAAAYGDGEAQKELQRDIESVSFQPQNGQHTSASRLSRLGFKICMASV